MRDELRALCGTSEGRGWWATRPRSSTPKTACAGPMRLLLVLLTGGWRRNWRKVSR